MLETSPVDLLRICTFEQNKNGFRAVYTSIYNRSIINSLKHFQVGSHVFMQTRLMQPGKAYARHLNGKDNPFSIVALCSTRGWGQLHHLTVILAYSFSAL